MKYRYKTDEEKLQRTFGDLLKLDIFGDYEEDGFQKLCRKADDGLVHDVKIDTLSDALLLLDYLSTSNRHWDSAPKLRILSSDHTEIFFQGRGNYGHIDNLSDGDVIIVEPELRTMIKSSLLNYREPTTELKAEILEIKQAKNTKDDLPFK